ncbi:MAG: DUF421 domain-containing protein [Oscillospiraceae bacterium]|nr:DUF421 domain-containing protein [Oscillospiraceae bacterium]MBR2977826.1 DUF421 domain-containing protein [Oscillospiraceae bacterium]
MLLTYLRTVVLYLTLTIVIRLMGKRQLGEMEPSEFVVAMLIADLAAVPMQDAGIPLSEGILPILTILALELLLSCGAFRFLWLRKLLCGSPVILMEDGKILYENLKKTRITVDELIEHIRENGTTDLSTVQYAILETNGNISTLLYAKNAPADAKSAGIRVSENELPVAVISDGKWLSQNLALCGRSRAWVRERLAANGCPTRDVLLFTVTSSGKTYLARKQEKQ